MWYRNSEFTTFTDVFKAFLQEVAEAGATAKVSDQFFLSTIGSSNRS
jgi:hypothetical protein